MQKQSCEFGKMNKRAWIQVVESSVAILIMIGFIILMTGKTQVKETNLQDKVNELALQIEQDETTREELFKTEPDCNIIFNKINEWTALHSAFTFGEELTCGQKEGKDIYSASVVISNLNIFKTFTLYVWK